MVSRCLHSWEYEMQHIENYLRNIVSKEAFDLFAVFSRFEYGMKKGGYRRQQYPDAAWPIFADALGTEFYNKVISFDEARILFDDPPDHLICVQDSVDWSGKPQSPRDVKELFDRIKDIRNNLFHGDKKHDRLRDQKLVIAALFVLNLAYDWAENDESFSLFISEMEIGL